jgi:hypothetical protein
VTAPPEFDALTEPILHETHGRNVALFSPDMLYRYLLTREWDATLSKLVVIGLNPSTATAEIDDPTIRRCVGYGKAWGYGGLAMLNLFAYRATDPKAMVAAAKRDVDVIGPVNDAVLDLYATAGRTILCAWGAHGSLRWRSETVVKRLSKMYPNLVCLGRTSAGEPKHPLYLRANLSPVGYP